MLDTMGKAVDYAVRYHGDQVAIVDGAREVTYRELGARVNQAARALLALGNEPGSEGRAGDRVGMLVPNCAEFLYVQYGTWQAGLCWTQLQPLGGPESWAYVLNDARARTLVYHREFAAQVERTKPLLESVRTFLSVGGGDELADPDLLGLMAKEPDGPPDVAVSGETPSHVTYSSGTTGLPKGILWDHRSWMEGLYAFMLEMPELAGGRFMHVTPLTHMTTLFVLPTWLRGGTNVVLPGLDTDLWFSTIAERRITATAIVPTILYMLMDLPQAREADLSSLGTIIYGGSPMAPERLRQGLELFGPVFVQGYACSEAGLISVLPKRDHDPERPERLASAGRPVLTAEVAILDPERRTPVPPGEPGEIAVRSRHHMRSYWHPERNQEAMTEEGFVLSGDIGRLAADGYLFIVDRKKDIIISGGFNVFPREVEDVLFEHPAVAQAAVIGIPDPKWGEAVHACVVLRPGAQATAEELQAFVKERKGPLYAPKSVEFITHIPLTPQGKPDRKVLREPHWRGQERQVH